MRKCLTKKSTINNMVENTQKPMVKPAYPSSVKGKLSIKKQRKPTEVRQSLTIGVVGKLAAKELPRMQAEHPKQTHQTSHALQFQLDDDLARG